METLRRLLATLVVAFLGVVIAASTAWLIAQVTAGVAEPRVAERVRAVATAAVVVEGWLVDAAQLATLQALESQTWAYLVDGAGQVAVTSPPAAGLSGLRRPVPEPGVRIGVDPFERRPMVLAAAAVEGGTVVAGMPVEGLVDLLGRLPEPDEGRVRLVDPTGVVLRPGLLPETLPRVGPNLAEPVRAAAGGPGFIEYPGEAGIAMSAAYAPAGHGWTVVLLEEAESFTPAAEGLRAVGAAVPGLSVLVLLLVIGFVALDARARRHQRQSERTKQAFLSVAGHELRTPLTVMSGMVHLLAREGEIPEPTRLQAARAAARQAKQLERLIERLLFVAHLESGVGVGVSAVPVDLAPVLERVVDIQRGLSPLHELDAELESPLPALADTGAVEQIVLHLLDNAVRYSPAGSTVRVLARARRRTVEIAVEDEGVGLPADASRIFDLFVQGETVDERLHDEGGVGLGLAIVRTLVTAMDGRVRAEGRDPGARLVVELPAAPGRD